LYTCSVFVTQSEIRVASSQKEALERAFEHRARLVDQHDGFLGLELLCDVRSEGRYVLLTRWRSAACFRAYMKSGDHKRAHERQHEGLGEIETKGGNLQQFESKLQSPSKP
jgi:heme-degrading monooxygenase HmoA